MKTGVDPTAWNSVSHVTHWRKPLIVLSTGCYTYYPYLSLGQQKYIWEILSSNSLENGGMFSELHEKAIYDFTQKYALLWIKEADNPDCLSSSKGT